ncbi:hypothetical protein [Streptomyces kronopolitis]|uniref:hypothetical protein n=1 Tax=Streptomyces kronopolitis TaxID=1612435 RepID=UPI003D977B2D
MPSETSLELCLDREQHLTMLRGRTPGAVAADGPPMNVFSAVVLLAALMVIAWLAYLFFCSQLARKHANWSDGAAKIARAFWRNVGRGIRSVNFVPRKKRAKPKRSKPAKPKRITPTEEGGAGEASG